MPEIVFWGATGQAKVLHEAIKGSKTKLVALVDNRRLESPVPSVPVLLGEAEFRGWLEAFRESELRYAIAIGGSKGSERIAMMQLFESHGLIAQTIVHATAFVARDAIVGKACQVLAQASVCSNANLGDGVIINTGASVDHDTIVGDGSHIAPGAVITGEVRVGTRVFVGAGAVVLPRVYLGNDSCVGAGAVVTKNVPPGSTVVGNPARPLSDKMDPQ